MKLLDKKQALAVIRKEMGKTGQNEFARELGVSPAILSTSLTDYREPSPKLLEAVGLERVTAYRRKE